MESNYDEDLSDNVFFQVLQNEFGALFERATLEGWIICVPRAGSMPKYALTTNDFFSHILIPNDELPETHFRTLNDKDVKINNRVLFVESEVGTTFSSHVLFEETFYSEDMLKYKVLCVESPLQQYCDGVRAESGITTVLTLRDCIDLLWTESCKEVLERMDDCISLFLTTNERLEFLPLQDQKDLVGGLYTKCLQIALKDDRLREKTSSNRYLLDNVKVSVESYVHHGIYKKLIKGITGCTAYEDASFNKIVRNLSDIQLRDLNIGAEFQSVIPKARSELRRVEGYSTVVGKVGCLRKTVTAISCQDSASSQTGSALAADELLPMLVFLVIKSGLPNWIAHLTYMKEFSYSSSNYHANQHSFLVTSLEAAITYIKDDFLVGPMEPESQLAYQEYDRPEDELSSEDEKPSGPGVTLLTSLFEAAKKGEEDEVKRILEQHETHSASSLEGLNLCHPLCSCDKCEKQLSYTMCNMAPTVNSCDDRGFTVLHIAAMYGQARVVDALLRMGAKPEKSDYKGSTALHYSCARGHQNTVLLLIHSGVKLNPVDNERNTPLHLAAANGHETCIKALLYYTEQTGIEFDPNLTNNHGDTPLHNAARWGYTNIVQALLEYGASPFVGNKRKQTPLDLAHNMHLLEVLSNPFRTAGPATPVNISLKNISVAAASTSQLDFSDERVDASPTIKLGVRPNSTDGIRKVERVLRAIMYGDVRLACFYLSIEPSSGDSEHQSCHPLCSCKLKRDESSSNAVGTKAKEPMNINVCDSDGMTPLHMASKCGRAELVKLLIDAKADVNVCTLNGMSPLHLACLNQRHRVAAVLLETHLCSIDAKDNFGNTALHYCCQNSNSKLVTLLLSYTPRIDIRNNDGKTPLDEAKEILSLTIIQLLTEYCLKD
ncbi:Vacuolar sorting protein 9 (VPS9) domain [Nesidiocoris tenuis]|uniref:Vacuolar sorting protein 9 (VPS9) domain n=1 Tax=Nesidiocoris tenuis TaxID=355587 RepID=A0ABN7B6V8_9HEMI|nr:Vacuolar sorting protein 9 (VPS9) domain [Nesidiocoris tenuis]